ncbi:hypothetical protein CPB83DRAFT_907364 [Crepidotus variabilis]|uniref:Uncharacterized protein n=1 Tax=Crepidotus variabilis TaxID=179855 RepID=A0A9P6JPJ4_9AGAR|nr:hypothetical protein CPB83DRAFT_907364 [Crepidotus variabilis]
METNRPRPSILSLFDPLSSSSSNRSSSPDSDKENNAGETSFFHPAGMEKPVLSPVHKPRRRLIDIGDMTIEEPQDLLEEEEELEAEIKQSFTLEEENENETLTFRDMAKAATPKWSERRAATIASPRSPPTPRTPLAEIFSNDEATPMARKRPFKRLPTHEPSKSTDSDTVGPEYEQSNSSPIFARAFTIATPPRPNPIPTIEVSEDASPTSSASFSPQNALGSSVATLELPTTTGVLISETPVPVLISPSSPESHHEPTPSPPPSGSRLRPNAHLLNQSRDLNRFSVDLQQSFNLHINSSETTFDLLNDKISFFGGNNSLDAFLEEGPSFGDEDSFGIISQKVLKKSFEVKADPPKTESSTLESVAECDTPPLGELANDPIDPSRESYDTINELEQYVPVKIEADDRVTSPTERLDSPSPSTVKASPTMPILKRSPENPPTPHLLPRKSRLSFLSTPSTSKISTYNPPRPVPALKIVKRSKPGQPTNMTSTTSTTGGASRRTSSVTSVNAPPSRVSTRASVDKSVPIPITANHGIASGQHTKLVNKAAVTSSMVNNTQSTDGPRRVLVSDGPKISTISNARTATSVVPVKPATSTNGPRRVPVVIPEREPPSVKPTMPAGSALKAPVKYATVGPAASSSIPKPVSRANPGSRIPAPSAASAKQRFGVPAETSTQSKGFFSRRLL